MPRKTRGRKRGGRNRGYFFRAGRGWFALNPDGKFVALVNQRGERLRQADCPSADVKAAYTRLVEQRPKRRAIGAGVTLQQVCEYYLRRAILESRASTVEKRADTLFDLCKGLPARFRLCESDATKADKVHHGFGHLTIDELRPYHLEQWLDAHPNWTDRRTRLQAVNRLLDGQADQHGHAGGAHGQHAKGMCRALCGHCERAVGG